MDTLRKLGKWIGGIVLAVVVILLATYSFMAYSINERTQKHYTFTTEQLPIPKDSANLAQGEHLATIKGCMECHGENLAGKVMIDETALGRLSASNLTRGKGGRPADYSTADWLRVLRHGVNRNGQPLLLMPTHETTGLTKSDLQAIIAYCQQVSAVDHQLPPHKLGPVINVMTYLGKMPLLPVEMIDHNQPMVAQTDTTVGIAQGKYLAVSCSGCHQPTFKGGESAIPGGPPVPNLTSTGATGRWNLTQFVATLRTGKTPTGHQLNNEQMPWKMTAQYSDQELTSLYQYFRSLN